MPCFFRIKISDALKEISVLGSQTFAGFNDARNRQTNLTGEYQRRSRSSTGNVAIEG